MTPFLSIIIPVYKAEEFIEDCLHSVFRQITDEVEVILVDDGTPDNSMAIVKHIFDPWIKSGQLLLLEQRNQGPGAARNTGMRKAHGDYIAFLDSDDVLLGGYFCELIDHIKSGVADIVEFGFKRFTNLSNLSKETYCSLYNFEGLQNLSDVREQVFSAGCWFPSTRIYRKRIINQYAFPEGTHYEDLMTIPFIYLQDSMVFFIDKPLLGYRFNPESITSKHTEKHLSEMHGFYKSIMLDTECDATKILKLKTARGMVFFYSELGLPGFPIDEMIADIKSMCLRPSSRKALRFPDWLFFHFPAIYVRFDKIRVPVKKYWRGLKKF